MKQPRRHKNILYCCPAFDWARIQGFICRRRGRFWIELRRRRDDTTCLDRLKFCPWCGKPL